MEKEIKVMQNHYAYFHHSLKFMIKLHGEQNNQDNSKEFSPFMLLVQFLQN